jgi:hypothetical protein
MGRPKSNADPLLKKLPTGFADEADRMNEQQLRDCIVESSNNIKVITSDMKENSKLQGATDIVKEMKAPYAEAKKAQAAKVQYCLRRLEETGVLSDEVSGAESD